MVSICGFISFISYGCLQINEVTNTIATVRGFDAELLLIVMQASWARGFHFIILTHICTYFSCNIKITIWNGNFEIFPVFSLINLFRCCWKLFFNFWIYGRKWSNRKVGFSCSLHSFWTFQVSAPDKSSTANLHTTFFPIPCILLCQPIAKAIFAVIFMLRAAEGSDRMISSGI